MNKKTLIYVALILAGAMASDKILSLPVLNKLPKL